QSLNVSGCLCYLSVLGLIGSSWAMVFASGGFQVKLYDAVEAQVTKSLKKIGEQMKELETAEMLKGSLTADQQITLISGCTDLKEAVKATMSLHSYMHTFKLYIWPSQPVILCDEQNKVKKNLQKYKH
uniref:3-hydroxyacyl-CoA dehydrogenase NAD binding domain-containing protein n=1 Tax=Laticauda laticaudata TaxID=8630 RepID=A0A8C5SKW5_LATLA